MQEHHRQAMRGGLGLFAPFDAPPRARVLVVDGDSTLRQSIADALRDAGIDADIELSSVSADHDRLVLDQESYVDLTGARVVRSDATIPLSPAEITLIQRLCSPRGTWRTTDFLAKAIGRVDAAGLVLVWKYISRIKAKLGPSSDAIEHVRNKGYRWR